MKLSSVEIDGYRRFNKKQFLHVDCRLVALVGPNEAGKTGILQALESLGTRTPFKTDGPSQDVSYGSAFPPDHALITFKFLLDDEDKAALTEVEEAAAARWLVVEKLVDGQERLLIYPAITRNFELRKTLLDQLPADRDSTTFSTLVSALAQRVDTLASETIELMKTLLEASTNSSYEHEPWAQTIPLLIDSETKKHPSERANAILRKRVPQFIQFKDQHRELSPQYDLREFFNANRPIPEALKNLVEVAGLSLRNLFQAGESGHDGKVSTLETMANDRLKEKMRAAWSQANVSIVFRLSNGVLKILIRTANSGFESIAERSLGLRQFVALFAFVMRSRAETDRNTVILIDEAESHLHYDAQADLIQMLAKQELADKVIYTTHSIGCLPEDLGSGVRLVCTTGDTTSEIRSKFWTADRIGLSPILFGMGAATMTFIPIRYCVLTEGPTDFLLLPTMLRQATKLEVLGYLVSPGLAEIEKDEIKLIQNDGSKVLYLVDGDEAGTKIFNMLVSDEQRRPFVLQLTNGKNALCDLEDFLSKEIYVAAINEELERSGIPDRLAVANLPEVMRPAAVKAWFKDKKVQEPNKVDIAYRILDKVRELETEDAPALLDVDNVGALKKLHEVIVNKLADRIKSKRAAAD
jgi:predicted ATP-dependent endonuclease of OLD family